MEGLVTGSFLERGCRVRRRRCCGCWSWMWTGVSWEREEEGTGWSGLAMLYLAFGSGRRDAKQVLRGGGGDG